MVFYQTCFHAKRRAQTCFIVNEKSWNIKNRYSVDYLGNCVNSLAIFSVFVAFGRASLGTSYAVVTNLLGMLDHFSQF